MFAHMFFLSRRFKLLILPPGWQSGTLIPIHRPSQVPLSLLTLTAPLPCLASITTWWWPLRPPRRPLLQRTTTSCSTVSCRTAPLRCCGSSRARLEAARWPPRTGAATAEAPAAWCRPAACGTETESETGTTTASQDCRGPRWKLRRRPFMAPYLTLSPLTRTQSELIDKGPLNNGSTCK